MANKIYTLSETAVVWSVGGTPDLDLGGLAADAVRVGQQKDFGAASRAFEYDWHFFMDGFDTAPVVGEDVRIYLAFSDGTNVDGDVGTADAGGATVDLPNLLRIGSVVVQTVTAGDNLIASGHVQIFARYVSVVIHNNTADALLGTADAHTFKLIPSPLEVQ